MAQPRAFIRALDIVGMRLVPTVRHARLEQRHAAHVIKLRRLRTRGYPLRDLDDDLPLADALARTLVEFNDVPESEAGRHRRRMNLLLTVPALQAHSMIMYADWRQVVATYAASRLGLRPDEYQPQLIGWLALGTALAAYEQWLAGSHDQSVRRLRELLVEGSGLLAVGTTRLSRSDQPIG